MTLITFHHGIAGAGLLLYSYYWPWRYTGNLLPFANMLYILVEDSYTPVFTVKYNHDHTICTKHHTHN
jgi:hypothetical protein